MSTFFSIIIPTYNRGKRISKSINSIINQSFKHWECIIVDDGSTDKTVAVINKYIKEDTRFSIYKRPTQLPKGANACRNYGFKQSKGNYIQFFDSDDLMLSNCLEARVVFLEKENLEYQGANFSGLKRRLKTNDSSVIIEIERPRDDSIIRVSVTKNFVFNDAWAQYRV